MLFHVNYWYVNGYLILMAIDNRTIQINAADFVQQYFHGITRYKIKTHKQLHPRQDQVYHCFIQVIKLLQSIMEFLPLHEEFSFYMIWSHPGTWDCLRTNCIYNWTSYILSSYKKISNGMLPICGTSDLVICKNALLVFQQQACIKSVPGGRRC